MNTQHTAGPWKDSGCPYGSKRYIWEMVGGERARRIAIVDDELELHKDVVANARLIAAAPALFEALKALIALDDDLTNLAGIRCSVELQNARKAIGKAEGN